MKTKHIIAGGGWPRKDELDLNSRPISGRWFLLMTVFIFVTAFGWPMLPVEWQEWASNAMGNLPLPETIIVVTLLVLVLGSGKLSRSNDELKKLRSRASSSSSSPTALDSPQS